LPEGSEFELPVPVSKLSEDSIKLEFAAARRIALVGADAHQPRFSLEEVEKMPGNWQNLSDLRKAGLN
jgi:hypothetical protein